MGGDLMAREWNLPGYTEVRALGSGGFGDVVLARHDASGTAVAIKYLRGELLADPEFAGMFRAEAAVLASLGDPNVVRLYEYVESPGGAAIVMELVEGVSLREILSRQGKTTPEAALVVLQGSLLGLAAVHARGVVHRDYKPENVLVNAAGASKLTDFGIAVRAGDRAMAAGTLAYAPPEQFTGSPASPATDVYAATATFYECLTGRPPFSGDTAERLMYQHLSEPVPLEPVPEQLRPLVEAGMAKDPGRRPADAAALVTELRTMAVGAYGPDWEQRGRSLLGEAAVLLAALWPSGAPPAPAPAPAQLTGTQLVAALLPGALPIDSGSSLRNNGPAGLPFTVSTNCTQGRAGDLFDATGLFFGFGTAFATGELSDGSNSARPGEDIFANQAVFQFASPAQAETFLSSARTCLIDNNAWSNGVDTAPVDGDQAVSATLRSTGSGTYFLTEALLVLHGTDVFGITIASAGAPVVTIPRGAELIAELIARVDALLPGASAVASPAPDAAPTAVPSPASSAVTSPGLPARQQAAQDLAGLLAQSGTDRTAITQAFDAVAACSSGLSQDETVFSTAAASRQTLLGKLATLTDRSALPASMLQDLTMAWQVSGEADQDFADWTQDEISRGCSTNYKSDANYQAAAGPDIFAGKFYYVTDLHLMRISIHIFWKKTNLIGFMIRIFAF